MTSSLLEIKNLTHSYGQKKVLNNLNLSVSSGEIFCILGESGCGKSTLLQSIAGFIEIKSGEVIVSGETFSSSKNHVPPEKRKIGLVFQEASLFPHMNVRDNIAYGISAYPREDQNKRVLELLELMGLHHYLEKYPHQLSGGEQQRVAIARAMAPNPEFLLLDEPFSNLDPSLKSSLVIELKSILKKNKMTAIFITHDQQEAFLLGDRIAILHEGCIQQADTPSTIFLKPTNDFVASFLGGGYLLSAKKKDNMIESRLGSYPLVKQNDTEVTLFFPSQALSLHFEPVTEHQCQIVDKIFCGNFFQYKIKLIKTELEINSIISKESFNIGDTVFLKIQEDLVHQIYS